MRSLRAQLLFGGLVLFVPCAAAQDEERASKGEKAFVDLVARLGKNEIIGPLAYDETLLEGMRAYGWQQTLEQPVSQELYWLVLSLIGDEEARRLIVAKIASDPNQPIGRMLSGSGVPTLIPYLAPVLLQNEEWQNLGFGGDVGDYPASFEMAVLIVRLIGSCPSFRPEVINWAWRFGEDPVEYDKDVAVEMRDILRQWWVDNERNLREGNYKAVKPGREPAPRPEPPRPTNVPLIRVTVPESVTPAPAVATTRSISPAPTVAATETSSASIAWLVAGGAVAVVLLVGLVIFWKGRA